MSGSISGFSSASESSDSSAGFDRISRRNSRALFVFQLSGRYAAFDLQEVERGIPMAELAAPPGLPSTVEGILNLGGVAVPVLRLDKLFGLPAQRIGLYSHLVVLRNAGKARVAVLADRINEVVTVPEAEFLPVEDRESFNGCAEAAVRAKDRLIHLLSSKRLLLAKEREALSDFQNMAQQRLRDWQVSET